ncbi:DNA internalization-related competence protein ComEC/Rec2 [Ruoffia halotolerans]|uniref:DNA internalization-related competence protein ComEC/Rec2 n=1 Tax=Ruoffia halotolerans TaxID=2748684 RepID=UPI0022A7CA09|nr:DNA internalization-related competence protein ComEC/Rec2 [Ruoffia halotolerans]
MIKYLQHIRYEWPFIFLLIYVVLQAFYYFSFWLMLPIIFIALRIICLGNLKTVITVTVLSILVLGYAFFQTFQFQKLEELPIASQEMRAILYTNPFDVQSDEDSVRGDGKVQIVHQSEKIELRVNFVHWLEDDEPENQSILEESTVWFVEGKFEKPDVARNFDVFDYKAYLATQNIAWEFEITNIYQLKSDPSFVGKLDTFRYKILEPFIKLNHHEWIAIHNKLLFNIDSDTYRHYKENFTALGVAHFFAISGFHIYFIRRLLNSVLLRFGMPIEYAKILITVVLWLYTWLVGWPIGVIRVLSTSALNSLKTKYRLPIASLDSLAIVGILFICFDPLNVLSLGYTLSFMMTFVVMSYNQATPNKHSAIQIIEMTFACLLLSWPIIMQTSFEWNVIQVVIVILFTVVFTHLIMPLVFLTTLWIVFSFPGLETVSAMLDRGVVFINELLSQSDVFYAFNLIVGKQTPVIFYLLILVAVFFIAFIHVRPFLSYGVFLLMYLIILFGVPYLDPTVKLTMIDVGQGDAMLFQLGHQQGNWLIDTGGKRLWEPVEGSNIDHSFAEWNLIPALKALGVNQLDGVIITHPDIDHIGNLQALSQAINIQELWVSDYTLKSNIWEEISAQVKVNTVVSLDMGQSYKHPTIPLTLYNPALSDIKYSQSESNDSSLITQIDIEGLAVLSLGDVTKRIETKILATYPEIRADILKVGHHGSNTSTSEELLTHTQPFLAFISAGVNNQYGHPHAEVTDLLNQHSVPYLSTEMVGAVQLTYHPLKGYKIRTVIEK